MPLDDIVSHTIGGLVPPGENAAPRRQLLWRWYMYTAVMILLFAVTADHGYIPALYAGMASKDDLARAQAKVEAQQQQQQQQLSEFQVDWLSQIMLDLALKECKDQPNAQLYEEKLQQLGRRYYQLTNQQWQRPPCPR